MGRLDEAFAQVARAKELDPLSLAVLTGEGDICLLARRYDDAIRIFKRVLEMDPTYHAARYPLANIYFLTGRHAEALALWEAVGIITPEDVEGARKELEKGRLEYMEGLIQLAPQRGAPPSWIASACAQVGRFDEAFEWLERAYQSHDFLLVALAVGPMYDPLRGDPRYQATVERLGLDKVVRPGAVPSSPPG
jgi:tetratricopeptide (TPR) repeat protein